MDHASGLEQLQSQEEFGSSTTKATLLLESQHKLSAIDVGSFASKLRHVGAETEFNKHSHSQDTKPSLSLESFKGLQRTNSVRNLDLTRSHAYITIAQLFYVQQMQGDQFFNSFLGGTSSGSDKSLFSMEFDLINELASSKRKVLAMDEEAFIQK